MRDGSLSALTHPKYSKELPALTKNGGFIFTSGNTMWDDIPAGAILKMHKAVKKI